MKIWQEGKNGKKELHDRATAFFRTIITNDVAGVSGESLKIAATVVFGIGDGRYRNTIPIGIYRSSGYVPILCPLFLQIRQRFDKNYRDVYVDLAVGVTIRCVDRLLIADRLVGPCHCRGKHVNPTLLIRLLVHATFPFLPFHSNSSHSSLHLVLPST